MTLFSFFFKPLPFRLLVPFQHQQKDAPRLPHEAACTAEHDLRRPTSGILDRKREQLGVLRTRESGEWDFLPRNFVRMLPTFFLVFLSFASFSTLSHRLTRLLTITANLSHPPVVLSSTPIVRSIQYFCDYCLAAQPSAATRCDDCEAISKQHKAGHTLSTYATSRPFLKMWGRDAWLF